MIRHLSVHCFVRQGLYHYSVWGYYSLYIKYLRGFQGERCRFSFKNVNVSMCGYVHTSAVACGGGVTGGGEGLVVYAGK